MFKAKELTVGLLFFGGLISLGFLTIVLTDFSLFKESHYYDILFDQANELKVNDNVLIMGTHQGKVQEIEFFDEPRWDSVDYKELWVRVGVKMDKPLMLKEDYRVSIRNANLLGGKVVDIRLGRTRTPVDPDNTMIVGLAVRDPIEAISDFIETNKGHVKRTLENIDSLVQNVAEWSHQVSRGQGPLGRLIYSEPLANNIESLVAKAELFVSDLNSSQGTVGLLLHDIDTRDKVKKLASDLAELTGHIAAGEGTLGLLVKDRQLYDRFMAVAEDIEIISARVEAGEGLAGKLLSEVSNQTYDDFAHIVSNVREVSDQVTKGDGLMSALIYDTTLTEDVRGTLSNAKTFTADIQLMIQDVKDGKGPLGIVLRNQEVALKVERIVDAILGSIEDAREAAPLTSLGTFLFGAI